MSNAPKVKVWIEENASVSLYQVPPTVLKRFIKMIAEYEVKKKKERAK